MSQLQLFGWIDIQVTEPPLIDELLPFSNAVFSLHCISTCFWKLLSLRYVQVDVVVDKNVSGIVFAVTIDQGLFVVMGLAKLVQETLVHVECFAQFLTS